MKIKNLPSVLFLGFITILVFNSWILSPIISAGDSWYYFPSMFDNHFIHPYAWYTTVVANGLGGQGFAYANVNIVASLALLIAKFFNLSWETTPRFLFYIPYIVLSLASSLFLVKKLFPKNNFWIFTPIIFSLNTYILMTVGGGQIITALSYSLIPFTLFSFMKLSGKLSSKIETVQYVIICALLLSAQTILDLRIAFITSLAVFLYLFFEFWDRELKTGLKTLAIYFLPFLILVLINSFWLIPVLLFGIDPIGQLGSDYRSTEIVKFLSFAKLENSIGLMHPYWHENIFGKIGFMKPEFLILPILAFSSLLFIGKDRKQNKIILYFISLALFAIFLAKGASEPFGAFYVFLFNNVPGFQLFRDSFKWYGLIALSFSILIPFSLDKISDLIQSKTKMKHSYLVIFGIFAIYVLFLLRPFLLGQVGGTFRSRTLPEEYKQLNSYLSQDKSFFRTFWMPNTMLFGYFTNINPQISARDFMREYTHEELIKKLNSPESQKLLIDSGVKYVIVPQDTEREIFLTERKYDEKKYNYIVKGLNEISWLKKEKQFGNIVVYKTLEQKDHFWCDCEAEIEYKFINPTHYELDIKNAKTGDRIVFAEAFDKNWTANYSSLNIQSSKFENKFNSFIIPENGDYLLNVRYELQKYVDLGVIISIATLFSSVTFLVFVLVKKARK